MRGLLYVPGDFLRRSPLLLDRSRDDRCDFGHSTNGHTYFLDRLHRFARGGLNAADLLADLAGGPGGLLGQRLDLGGHHGKTAASVSSPRCRRIQRQPPSTIR